MLLYFGQSVVCYHSPVSHNSYSFLDFFSLHLLIHYMKYIHSPPSRNKWHNLQNLTSRPQIVMDGSDFRFHGGGDVGAAGAIASHDGVRAGVVAADDGVGAGVERRRPRSSARVRRSCPFHAHHSQTRARAGVKNFFPRKKER